MRSDKPWLEKPAQILDHLYFDGVRYVNDEVDEKMEREIFLRRGDKLLDRYQHLFKRIEKQQALFTPTNTNKYVGEHLTFSINEE